MKPDSETALILWLIWHVNQSPMQNVTIKVQIFNWLGSNAVHISAEKGHQKLLEFLVNNKEASIHKKDDEGKNLFWLV